MTSTQNLKARGEMVSEGLRNAQWYYPLIYVRPTPIGELVDEASNNWTNFGANERRCSVHNHRCAELLFREHVAHRASSNAQERAPSKSVDEAHNQHRCYVVGDCTWDEPDEIHAERAKVDNSTAVKFGQG